MSNSIKKKLGSISVIAGTILQFTPFALAGTALRFAGLALLASIKKPKVPDTPRGWSTDLNLSGDPIGVRMLAYGRDWTGGFLRFRGVTGTTNENLYMVIVLAGSEIDSVESQSADTEVLTLDGSGNVTAPAKWVGLMNVRYYTGTDAQAADATLDAAFPEWTTSHRLRGLAYAIVKLTFNDETLNTPPSFRFLVKGRKIYDPRKDTTVGGSGSHRVDDQATWEWSNNVVLCANDYMRGVYVNSATRRIAGMGLASTRFDWANVMAEANVCDETVALAGSPSLGDEARYTFDGFVDPRQSHGENVRQFEMSMAGDILPSDAKWRYFAGAYRTPTVSLADEDYVGELEHVVTKGKGERVDTAQGLYAQKAAQGDRVAYAPISLSGAVSGEERTMQISLPFVGDWTDTPGVYDGGARAQRVAKIWLEREAAGKTLSLTTKLHGLRCVPGETALVTRASLGLAGQAMAVKAVQLARVDDDEGHPGVAAQLLLEAGPSSIYTWNAEETFIGPSSGNPGGRYPPIIQGDPLLADPNFSLLPVLFDYSSGGSDAGYYWAETSTDGTAAFRYGFAVIDPAGGLTGGSLALTTEEVSVSTDVNLARAGSLRHVLSLCARGEYVKLICRVKRTTAVGAGAVFGVNAGLSNGFGFVQEYGTEDLITFDATEMASWTLDEWQEVSFAFGAGDQTETAEQTQPYFAVQVYLSCIHAMTVEIDSIRAVRTASRRQLSAILHGDDTPDGLTAAERASSIIASDFSKNPIDIRRFGALTSASDNSTSINNCILVATYFGGRVFVPEGEWKITSPLHMKSNVELFGVGRASHIHNTNVSASNALALCFTFGTYDFNAFADAGSPSAVTSYGIEAVSRGDQTLTMQSAGDESNFTSGDVVYVYSGGGYTDGGGGRKPAFQQISVIASVGSGTVTIADPIYKSYAPSPIDLFIAKSGDTDSSTHAFTDELIKNPYVHDIAVESDVDAWQRLGGCYRGRIENIHIVASDSVFSCNGFAHGVVRGITGTTRKRAIELAYFCHDSLVDDVDVVFEAGKTTTVTLGVVSFEEGAHHNTVKNVRADYGSSAADAKGVEYSQGSLGNVVDNLRVRAAQMDRLIYVDNSKSAMDYGENELRNSEIVVDTVDLYAITLGAHSVTAICGLRCVNTTLRATTLTTGTFNVSGSNCHFEGCTLDLPSGTLTFSSGVENHRFVRNYMPAGTAAAWETLRDSRPGVALLGNVFDGEESTHNTAYYSSGNPITSTSSSNVICAITIEASTLRQNDMWAFEIGGTISGINDVKHIKVRYAGTDIYGYSSSSLSGNFHITGTIIVQGASVNTWRVTGSWILGGGSFLNNVRASATQATTSDNDLDIVVYVDNASDSITIDHAWIRPLKRH